MIVDLLVLRGQRDRSKDAEILVLRHQLAVGPTDRPPVSSEHIRATVSQGGSSRFAYALPASATTVDVYADATQCAGSPLAHVELPASLGDHVIVLLYGTLSGLKSMVLAG